MTPAWFAVYAGYDDAALVALANAGLLRRARKDLAAAEVSLSSQSATEAVITCGTAVVRLGPKGPVAASCSCPTAGVCQHVVAACLWAREQAPATAGAHTGRAADDADPAAPGVDPAAPDADPAAGGAVTGGAGDGPAFDALAALLAQSPAEVCQSAGKQAVRMVVERLPAALLAALGDGGAGVQDACDLVSDGARLTISWPDAAGRAGKAAPGGGARVVFVAPAGFAGMVVAGPGSTTAHAAARLEAVVRVFARQGRPWSWPHDVEAHRLEGLTVAQRAAIEEVSAVVGQVVDAGLSHLGADAADTLRGAAARARLVGLLLLQRLLLAAAGLVDALAARDDDATESDALGAMAEAWALAAALRDAPAGALPGLVGAPARRADASAPADDEAAPGRLVPLGVRWWQTPSGSRGLTLTAWDTRHATVRSATAGRPAGADPSFRRDMDLPLLWNASVAAVCAGPFELDAADLRPDGGLGATPRTSHVSAGGFDVGELRQIADSLAAGGSTGTIGFGRTRRRVRLLMVRETGAVGVDEVRRDVTWPVTSADGVTRLLRIGVEHEHRVEALLSVVASRRAVVAVLVEREPGGDADEPVGIFLRTGQGSVELFSPSMSPVWRGINWSALRRLTARIGALRRTSVVHVAERVVPGPVARACGPALAVVDALGATGRRRLTDRQAEALRVQARLAADLGMESVSGVIEALTVEPTTSAVLRARFVLARAVALADG